MHDESDFLHVGVGSAERVLEVILAAQEAGILRSFVSGEVAVVLSVDAKHGAARRGEEASHVITGAPAVVKRKIFLRNINSLIDR